MPSLSSIFSTITSKAIFAVPVVGPVLSFVTSYWKEILIAIAIGWAMIIWHENADLKGEVATEKMSVKAITDIKNKEIGQLNADKKVLNQQLTDQTADANRKIAAANAANAALLRREAALNKIIADGAPAHQALKEIKNDSCLDANIPADFARLFAVPAKTGTTSSSQTTTP